MALQLQHPVYSCSAIPASRSGGPRNRQAFRLNALANANAHSRTQRIMESISTSSEVGGAGGAYSYNALKRLDQLWCSLCSQQSQKQDYPKIVSNHAGLVSNSDLDKMSEDRFDVIVCGGTLGIFVATALSSKGLRVGIVERNLLRGREQEWNISKKELLALINVGVLAQRDIQEAILVEFNPNRCGFEGKGDIWIVDILNLGVSPAKLLEIMKRRFISSGGVILEGFSVSKIRVYDDAAVLQLSDGKLLHGRLILDAMGNFSPVVKQIWKKTRWCVPCCRVLFSRLQGQPDK